VLTHRSTLIHFPPARNALHKPAGGLAHLPRVRAQDPRARAAGGPELSRSGAACGKVIRPFRASAHAPSTPPSSAPSSSPHVAVAYHLCRVFFHLRMPISSPSLLYRSPFSPPLGLPRHPHRSLPAHPSSLPCTGRRPNLLPARRLHPFFPSVYRSPVFPPSLRCTHIDLAMLVLAPARRHICSIVPYHPRIARSFRSPFRSCLCFPPLAHHPLHYIYILPYRPAHPYIDPHLSSGTRSSTSTSRPSVLPSPSITPTRLAPPLSTRSIFAVPCRLYALDPRCTFPTPTGAPVAPLHPLLSLRIPSVLAPPRSTCYALGLFRTSLSLAHFSLRVPLPFLRIRSRAGSTHSVPCLLPFRPHPSPRSPFTYLSRRHLHPLRFSYRPFSALGSRHTPHSIFPSFPAPIPLRLLFPCARGRPFLLAEKVDAARAKSCAARGCEATVVDRPGGGDSALRGLLLSVGKV
ncbi:hypothetical protein DFH09DRAFT_477159, partial [Mycena vulgaris]